MLINVPPRHYKYPNNCNDTKEKENQATHKNGNSTQKLFDKNTETVKTETIKLIET